MRGAITAVISVDAQYTAYIQPVGGIEAVPRNATLGMQNGSTTDKTSVLGHFSCGFDEVVVEQRTWDVLELKQ